MLEVANHPRVLMAAKAVLLAVPLVTPILLLKSHALALRLDPPDLGAFYCLGGVFVWGPLIEYVWGIDRTNPSPAWERFLAWRLDLRLYPLLVLPLELVTLSWAASVFASPPYGWVGQVGWILSSGLIGGYFAITAAHELVHRDTRVERVFGGLLLALVCYPSFKVEHIRGHHVRVATPEDPSTAAYDEGVYRFLARVYVQNVKSAFRIEAARLRKAGHRPFGWRNELCWWFAVSAALCALFGLAHGATGVLFFLGQSFVAISLLEIVNYIQHYGLQRERLPTGRYEPVGVEHSWSAAFFISNVGLFQLPRHSDHHVHATRPYPLLRHVEAAPQLPGGFTTMVPLALVPPLWRRVMNPRVRSYLRSRRAGSDPAPPATARIEV